MRRIVFFLLSPVAILLIAAAVLVVFRIDALNQAGPWLLNRIGLGPVRVQVTALTLDSLALDHLETRLPEDGARILLQGIRLRWRTGELIRTRRLRALSIDRLRLILPPDNGDKTGTAGPDPARIRDQIKKFLPLFPFHTLTIKQLDLQGTGLKQLSGPFSVHVRRQNQGLAIGIRTGSGPALEALLPGSGSWHLSMDTDSGRAATLDLVPESLEVTVRADLEKVAGLGRWLGLPLPPLSGRINAALSSLAAFPCSLTLSGENLRLDNTLAESVHIALGIDRSDTTIHLTPQSRLRLNGVQMTGLTLESLTASLAATLSHHQGKPVLTLSRPTRISGQGLRLPGLRLDTFAWSPLLTAAFKETGISIALSPPSPLSLTGIKANDLVIDAATITGQERVTLSGKTGSWELSRGSWLIRTDLLAKRGVRLRAEPLRLNLGPLILTPFTRLRASLDTTSMTIDANGRTFTATDVALTVHSSRDQVDGTLALTPAPLNGRIQTDFRVNLIKGQGQATIRSQDLTLDQDRPLSALMRPWPVPGDLNSGSLNLQGTLSWQTGHPPDLRLRLHLANGRGRIRDFVLSDVTLDQDLQILPVLRSRTPATVRVDRIQTPVPLQDLEVVFTLDPAHQGSVPVVSLRRASFRVFDGTVSAAPLRYDPARPRIATTVTLHHIDLARILALHQVKGLSVTGRMNGHLPVRFANGQLHIDQGTLTNSGPGGIIRYVPEQTGGLSQSPLTGYALKALKEFHYSLLRAGVNYQPDGTLRADFHLEGKSPELGTTRPVHLNINTEQNLLSLLKSLRYSENIDRELSRKASQVYGRPNKP